MRKDSRFLLLVVGSVTCLCTLTSVKYLSTVIHAQHASAAGQDQREAGKEWQAFIGRAEANIGSHLPQFMHLDARLDHPQGGLPTFLLQCPSRVLTGYPVADVSESHLYAAMAQVKTPVDGSPQQGKARSGASHSMLCPARPAARCCPTQSVSVSLKSAGTCCGMMV